MKFIHHFSFVGGSRCSVQLPPLEVAAVGPDAHAGPLPHVEDRPAGAGAGQLVGGRGELHQPHPVRCGATL